MSTTNPTLAALRELAAAALAYDEAIKSCANNPEKMASFCSAKSDDLDGLYFDLMNKARVVISNTWKNP